MSGSVLLEVQALSIAYGSDRAVRDVSFALPRGRSLALAGSNGAGKTSVLGALAGLRVRRQTLDGRLAFDGATLEPGDVAGRVAAGIRLVPDRDKVFGLLTVAENLAIGAARSRNGAIGMDDVIGWFPRLGERSRSLAGNLSGGEQQMLGIGMALLGSPQLLLLDEPTLGLAVPVIEDLCERLARLREETGLTMIVAESDSQWLTELADSALVLDRGRLLRRFDPLAQDNLPAIHDLMVGLAVDGGAREEGNHDVAA
ncbi:ATP-binding cassette domain-containing protein [Paraburkholderia lycopersici]|uniref:Branched-chain amino acid transport system ATP-binding protein n=1 Tax=Paraburkholderia lycopersici TaxID=416944 RepID=A0A1G6QBA3_9BURK|nr:ATP-binding cassette domain-containing protein [Paraburkholderia lycopersici]SDC89760.1 branched-chain amino acid transport system ATP-binding protein [Paraburkholderia lycopersici]